MSIPVELEREEWDRVLTLLGNLKEAWIITNPLITKILKQVQQGAIAPPVVQKGNSDDVSARSKAR